MLLSGEQWDACWDDFTRTAFRLEVQQTYAIPRHQPDFQRFLRGDPRPEQYNSKWQDKVRAWAAEGKGLQRAKVVRRPFADYVRYLLSWAIPGNVAAGEDYRIVDDTDGLLDVPDQDFWMFDEQKVVHLNFDSEGRLISHELIEDPDIDQYLKWRDLALARGVPFSEWDAGA